MKSEPCSAMLSHIVDAVRQMFFLLRDVEETREAVASLKEQLAETNEMVRQLSIEVQHNKEAEQHQREKLVLGLENALLRMERRLAEKDASQRKK